jgi:SpoVK/Ycf46/Vps4 family AAA+-type ATPase
MLDKMVGGEAIRGRLEEIVSQIELAHKDKSMSAPCIHMRFVGNPGTGKTTVARIVGKILKEKGILRVGSFFEYAGRDFCGRYIGETAPKTSSICRDAYGSVLFIDEAYTLYRGEDNERDFGKEVLDTLIAEMENHRSDFVVIMAGYTDEMNQLMKGNAGLASRMPYVIEFPNFTRDQLFAIYRSMMEEKFAYSDDLLPAVKEYFDSLPDAFLTSKEFSNGRFVRNLFERTWAKAAMRCQLAKITNVTLTKDDFVRSIADSEFKINAVKKKRSIGFIDA